MAIAGNAARRLSAATALRRLAVAIALVMTAACASTGLDTVSTLPGGLPQISVQTPIGLSQSLTTRAGDRLISALQSRGVSVSPAPDAPARYKLQGYCSASGNGRETGIACVWDATTAESERAQRIVTEDTVSGSDASDPWSVVTPATMDRIADAVAAKVAAWLNQSPVARSGGGLSLPTLSSLGLTSGSYPPVMVTGVRGAPGDGNAALARAMASALRTRNVPVTGTNARAFQLVGTVALSGGSGATQQVTIEWALSDSQGNPRGTVTQRNEIPRGALDGAWGATANASAAAAAQTGRTASANQLAVSFPASAMICRGEVSADPTGACRGLPGPAGACRGRAVGAVHESIQSVHRRAGGIYTPAVAC